MSAYTTFYPGAGGLSTDAATGAIATLGQEFYVTSDCVLLGAYIYRSGTGGSANPTAPGALYTVADGAKVTGSDFTINYSAGAGWKTQALTTPIRLTAAVRYKIAITTPSGHPSKNAYWSSGGGGASGWTVGPLVVPGTAGTASGLQDSFTTVGSTSTIAYPSTQTSSGRSYWLDVVVSDLLPAATTSGATTRLAATATLIARPTAATSTTSGTTTTAVPIRAAATHTDSATTLVGAATRISMATAILGATAGLGGDFSYSGLAATLAAAAGLLAGTTLRGTVAATLTSTTVLGGAPTHHAHFGATIGARSGVTAAPQLISDRIVYQPSFTPAVWVGRDTTRFIAQLIGGDVVTWDLPLADATIKFTLSGPAVIAGKLAPELVELRDAGLTDWGAWIHYEDGGVIRASGLITPATLDGETLTLECEGASTYPHGIPYLGTYSVLQTDAADIVREMWRHIQSYPDGDLGVTVTGVTGVLLGQAKTDENPDLGPYELQWWNDTDCGDEITKLATETPFDFIERDQWNTAHTVVEHYIDIAPRIGRRRDDLRFAEDENILQAVTVAQNTDYANTIVGSGSGEGSAKIHQTFSTTTPGKLRRCYVLTNTTVTAQTRMLSLIQAELPRHQYPVVITQIVVDAHHDNAPLGAYQCGDDILVQATVPYLGDIRLWHRITGFEVTPDADTVAIDLKRIDPN